MNTKRFEGTLDDVYDDYNHWLAENSSFNVVQTNLVKRYKTYNVWFLLVTYKA